jgi:hypothetical protein
MVNAKKDRPWEARQDRGRYDKTRSLFFFFFSCYRKAKGVVLFVQRESNSTWSRALDIVSWTLLGCVNREIKKYLVSSAIVVS